MPEEHPQRRSSDNHLLLLDESVHAVQLEVAELRNDFKNFRGNQEQLLMLHQRRIDLHEELLTGKEGKNGLASRCNRLEEREGARTWHLRAIWTALLVGVANFLRELALK